MLKHQYHKGKFIVVLANTEVTGIKRKRIIYRYFFLNGLKAVDNLTAI